MCPGAHQPAFLIGQPRQLHLQPPGLALRALAENFEDEPGAVEDLGVPGLFEVALLDRRQRVVDDDDLCLFRAHNGADLLNLARAEQGRGTRLRQRHRSGEANLKPDGLGEARRLRQALRSCQIASRLAGGLHLRSLADWNGDDGPRRTGWKGRQRTIRLLGPAMRLRFALLVSELLQLC